MASKGSQESPEVDPEESFKPSETKSFWVEKSLLILTIIVFVVAIWTLSLRYVAQIPIPALDIAALLVGVWMLFMLLVARRYADFVEWYDEI